MVNGRVRTVGPGEVRDEQWPGADAPRRRNNGGHDEWQNVGAGYEPDDGNERTSPAGMRTCSPRSTILWLRSRIRMEMSSPRPVAGPPDSRDPVRARLLLPARRP